MTWETRTNMDKKIVDYKVISDCSTAVLEEQVKKYIADGWQPYGNLVVSGVSTYNKYREMVKYEE